MENLCLWFAQREAAVVAQVQADRGAFGAPLPWVPQLFRDLNSQISAVFKVVLKPLEEQVGRLESGIQKIQENSSRSAQTRCSVTR